MLSKLAKMNAKRSIKNYVIYLITVILSFSFMFAFNLISNSKEVLELSSTMANFKVAMYFTSAIVIFIVGFLINYTTKFMFQKVYILYLFIFLFYFFLEEELKK